MNIFFLVLLLLPLRVLADDAPFEQGKDYELVQTSDSKPTSNNTTTKKTNTADDKVSVVEFFSYGCPWCYRLESSLEKWLANKPANVNFERVPATFNTGWTLLAKAYYTAVALKKENKMTPVIFKAMHEQNIVLDNEQKIADFFVQNQIIRSDFDSAFHFSPGIDAKIIQGEELMKRYGIISVPTIVVAGKYKTNTAMVNGDMPRMMAVVTYLVKLVSTPQ